MRFSPLLALPLFAIAPVQAQDLSGPLAVAMSENPPADCRAAFKMMSDMLTRTKDTRIEQGEDSCTARNFEISLDTMIAYQVEEASITVPDLLNALVAPRLFPEAVLDMKGVRPVYPDQPLMSYITNLTTDGFNIHIDLTVDTDAKVSTLNRFTLDAGRLGNITFAGQLSNFVDSFDFDFEQDWPQPGARVDYLDITLNDTGFFRVFVLPILGSLLPYGQDPRPFIATTQASTIAIIDGLPVSDTTKTAATAFINAFPNPKGNWHLRLEAPNLSPADLDIENPLALIGVIDKIDITMTGPEMAEGDALAP